MSVFLQEIFDAVHGKHDIWKLAITILKFHVCLSKGHVLKNAEEVQGDCKPNFTCNYCMRSRIKIPLLSFEELRHGNRQFIAAQVSQTFREFLKV